MTKLRNLQFGKGIPFFDHVCHDFVNDNTVFGYLFFKFGSSADQSFDIRIQIISLNFPDGGSRTSITGIIDFVNQFIFFHGGLLGNIL